MKRERDPTRDEFDKLLLWFDSDRSTAGNKYNLTQTRLIRVFASRGCDEAEYLALEVANRVAVRIDVVRLTYPDAHRCCLAFVENVHREYLRDEAIKKKAIPPPPPPPPDELEKEDNCLSECMGKLTAEEQDFIVRYFQGEKGIRIANRKKLAQELQLSPNALRIQAHRARKNVRGCLRECLEQ